MWKSIIFTLLQPSGELYITESIKASSVRAKGATVLDEFAFSLGHLKGRKCSISVGSSWNWNGNGKQCLKLCVELHWGAEPSWRHRAVITPHAKTQQCFLSPRCWDWMTEGKGAQGFSSNTQRHKWMAGTRASYLTNGDKFFLVVILKVPLQIPIICYPKQFNCVWVLEAVWYSVDKCLTKACML